MAYILQGYPVVHDFELIFINVRYQVPILIFYQITHSKYAVKISAPFHQFRSIAAVLRSVLFLKGSTFAYVFVHRVIKSNIVAG